MSVVTGTEILQADHRKLMLTAEPLGRHGEVLDDTFHGIVGYIFGKKVLPRGISSLSARDMSQLMDFSGPGAEAGFTVDLPTVPEFCDQFNLQNGSYVELLVKNSRDTPGTAYGTVVFNNPTDSGWTMHGTSTHDSLSVVSEKIGKIGVYVKDRTSTDNSQGADIWLIDGTA